MPPSPRLRPPLLLLLAFTALPAGATTLVHQEVPELTRASDAVVRATVLRTASRWSADRRRILTDVDLQVSESLKGGEAAASVVRVVQPGGEVGDVGQRVEGLASFRAGEEVVVFLEKRAKGRFVVSGMALGKFRVERSAAAAPVAVPEPLGDARVVDAASGQEVAAGRRAVPLESLRRQVREASARAPASTTPGRAP
jgi:hypothetical protein